MPQQATLLCDMYENCIVCQQPEEMYLRNIPHSEALSVRAEYSHIRSLLSTGRFTALYDCRLLSDSSLTVFT